MVRQGGEGGNDNRASYDKLEKGYGSDKQSVNF